MTSVENAPEVDIESEEAVPLRNMEEEVIEMEAIEEELEAKVEVRSVRKNQFLDCYILFVVGTTKTKRENVQK